MMENKCTIVQIAKESGFSKSTVSKVIRNEPYVGASTKEKILKVMKKYNYHPDEIARSLVTKKAINFIGLIISDITNPFFSEVALGVEEEAKKRKCQVILCNTNYDEEEEKKYIDILIRNRAIGILLATPKIDDKNIETLLDLGYPFVLITRKVRGLKTNLVSVDHYKSSKMAVNYLIQKGHKKIAHFTGNEKTYGVIQRLNGYKSALNENNIEVNNNFIFKNTPSIEGGYECAKQLLETDEKFTAIFATGDLVAIGAMEYLKKNGYRIPEDYSIIGYDNIYIGALESINLTTVHQPKFELGAKAVEILYKEIDNNTATNSAPKPSVVKLDSYIVERGSVLDLNNN